MMYSLKFFWALPYEMVVRKKEAMMLVYALVVKIKEN